MLRASKTLQPENDTRRLRLVSMNGESFDGEPTHAHGQLGAWKSGGNQVRQSEWSDRFQIDAILFSHLSYRLKNLSER
jgi:hypothetical protein